VPNLSAVSMMMASCMPSLSDYVTKPDIEDIIVLVGLPTFMSSIFPTLPLGLLVSCILYHQEDFYGRAEAVQAVNAMNNYPDFPLAACKGLNVCVELRHGIEHHDFYCAGVPRRTL
jgi:hypothetical protein